MFKAAIALLVIVAAILLGVYYFGGVSSYDPTARGREAKAALSAGMTWTQVLDAAGEPGWYELVDKFIEQGPLGVELVDYRPGAKTRFERQRVQQDIADGKVPYGFIFRYYFSPQVAFRVWFNSNGLVQSIEDVMTMADLLDTRGD
jgi:hypothetical protein